MSDNTIIYESFQCHNKYIDEIQHLLSGDEFKILIFAVRHIIGWVDRIDSRRARISISMFENGFESRNGRMFHGCGLSKGAIIKNIKPLVKYGLLKKIGKPTHEGQLYELTSKYDLEGLQARQQSVFEANKKRTEKATKRAIAKRNNTGGMSDVPVTSDVPEGVTSEVTQTNTSLNPKKQKLQSEDCDTIPFDDKPSQKQMFGQLLILFDYDPKKLTKTLKGVIGRVAKELREAGYLLEDVTGIYNHVDSKDFSGGFTPSALLKYASEWHSQQPKQTKKPTQSPVNVEPPPAEMIHKWIANGKSIRDILNIMGAAKIPEHKAIKYLNELGVTA